MVSLLSTKLRLCLQRAPGVASSELRPQTLINVLCHSERSLVCWDRVLRSLSQQQLSVIYNYAALLLELGVFLLSSLMRPIAKEEKKNKWAAVFDSSSKCEPRVQIVKEAIQRGKVLDL